MMTIKRTIAAVAVSTLMLGTVSTGALILSTDVVYAKGNDKNDDRGNSGNNDRGNSGNKSSKSNGGSSKSKSASSNSASGNGGGFLGLFKKKDKKPAQHTASAAPSTAKAKPAKAVNRGALASELKGLNAAHANPNALKNASPNSMVGKVAAYQAAVLNQGEIEELEALLLGKEGEISALEETKPVPSSDNLTQQIADINALLEDDTLTENEVTDLNTQLGNLETQLEDTLLLESQIDGLIAEIQVEVDGLGEEIALLKEEPTPEEALAIAADGRELSPEALAELHRLLDLDPPEEEIAEGADSGEAEETPVVQ